MNELARRSLIQATGAALAAGVAGPALADATHTAPIVSPGPQLAALPDAGKVAETKAALRDLWIGHIFWVRGVVLGTLTKNDAAAKAAEQATVANAKDIAGAIEPFYGKPAAGQLFNLLAGHYGAVKEYLSAAAASDADGSARATEHLTANAQEIAGFLAGANPNLPQDTLNELLLAHGGHHLQQIQEVQAGQYEKETATWSAMKGHIYVIADALTDGLAKQFPDKF